jgi:hypothetical protein
LPLSRVAQSLKSNAVPKTFMEARACGYLLTTTHQCAA